jgi:hypothetical protein
VELGGTLLALRTLLSLGCPAFACLRLLCVPFGGRRMFRCAFTLVLGLVLLLRCHQVMRLGFLAVSRDLSAKPRTFKLALAAPLRRRSSGCQQQKRDSDHNSDRNGDYDDC